MKKYMVNDRVLALGCGMAVRVEVVDCATGAPFEEQLAEVRLEMMVLDGSLCNEKIFGEVDRWGP
jgi:hypothetical protein